MISISVLALEFCIKAFIRFMPNSINTEAVDFVSIFTFSVAFALDLAKSKKLKLFSAPLFFGYIFRVFLVFWDIYGRNIFPLPNSGADTEGFYNKSVMIMNYYDISDPFSNVMGNIFKIVGPSRLYGQFIIVLFSLIALIILASLLYEFEISDRVKQVVCGIVAMLPNLAILSSIFLRESIMHMLIAISIFCFYKWFSGKRNLFLVLAWISVFGAARFHSSCVAVVGGYIAILMLYDRENRVFKFKAKNIIPTILCVLVMSYLFSNYGDKYFAYFQKVDNITDIGSESTDGGSSYAQYVGNSRNMLNIIIFTIPRIFFFIASPLPIQWRGISDIIAFCFSSMFFICVAWFTIKYFRFGGEKNRSLIIALTIIIVGTFFLMGWGVVNAGTACRHRDKITIICALLLALTYNSETFENRLEKHYSSKAK